MTTTDPPSVPDENHPAYKHADAFCKKHFGNDVRELGWEEHVLRAIADGEEVTKVCEDLADEYGLDYLDAAWGLGKPDLSRERFRG